MEASYKKASYRNRLFAYALDLLLMIVTALFLMLGAHPIVTNSDFYKEANSNINQLEMSTGLYVERSDGVVQLMCDFHAIQVDGDYELYANKFDQVLTEFYSNSAILSEIGVENGMEIYNNYKIPEGQTSSKLFIYKDASHLEIIPQETATYKDLYNFYCEIMSNTASKYVMSLDEYISNSRVISLSFIFLELALPIVISSLIYELVIPLCLRRGKKTLGKLIFKLSVVDARGLSCTWTRYILRYLLLLFIETIMSVVALLIPLIVSFSMFVFSKAGQSFHDYVTNTYVVEAPTKSICLTEDEFRKKVKDDENFTLNKEDVVY